MRQLDAEDLSGLAFTPGWEFDEIVRDGKRAGFVMHMGNEVHVFRQPEFTGRWLCAGDIARIFTPLMQQHGYLTTKVRSSNANGQRLCARFGFVKTHDDGEVVIMKMERLNHARH